MTRGGCDKVNGSLVTGREAWRNRRAFQRDGDQQGELRASPLNVEALVGIPGGGH